MSPPSHPSPTPSGETSCPPDELRLLVDTSSDLIFSAGPESRIRFLNRIGCMVLGYSAAEASHLHLRDIVDSSHHGALEEALARTEQRPTPAKLTFLARGGRQIHVHGQFQLHRLETASVVVGVFRDGVTFDAASAGGWHESLAEQQIIQNVAREKELTELKSHFISMASHELRTPLAALSLGVDFLAKYWPKLAPEQINKNLKSVDATVRQLRSVLDDVLIISRDEEGQLRCKRSLVELVAFARKIAEEAATADLHRHPIAVHSLSSGVEANLDPQLLSHILTNLLGNACKYSPPGAPIDFTIASTRTEVVLEIADHGIGIPAEDQSKLFALFFRGSNVGTAPGTGLGLVVVRRCVEAHRGTITFVSTPGQGTRFTVTLPVGAPT